MPFNRKKKPNKKHLLWVRDSNIFQLKQIYSLWMHFCITNICAMILFILLHHAFLCTWCAFVHPLQRWVFSIWLSSLATEQQSASRIIVCGDYGVGRDQHVTEPGEKPVAQHKLWKLCQRQEDKNQLSLLIFATIQLIFQLYPCVSSSLFFLFRYDFLLQASTLGLNGPYLKG